MGLDRGFGKQVYSKLVLILETLKLRLPLVPEEELIDVPIC